MRTSLLFVILLLLIGVVFIVNLLLGSVVIPANDVLHTLWGTDDVPVNLQNAILKVRLPQTLVAMTAGAGLAVSGLQMQTVFRNPLAGPTVLGISNGALLGVAIIQLTGLSLASLGLSGQMTVAMAAVTGALVVMAIIMVISLRVRSSVTLLVMGVMIGYVANALIGVLKFFGHEDEVHRFALWTLGSFSRVAPENVPLFVYLVLGLLGFALLLIKPLNLMLLGDNYARNLGLNIVRSRMLVILCSGALCAVVTAYCGPIAFLGLAVPHLCRGLFGTSNHAILLPGTILMGALLALACNLGARVPGYTFALPVNSVTALVGAPVVCWVLFRRR